MVFNSLIFIVFFAFVLLVYNLPLSWRMKKLHLWISSYLFYAAWNPPFVILLWISTLVDWFAGKWMANAKSLIQKRAFLIMSLSANLGLLGYFKYGEFLLDSFITVLTIFNIAFHPVAPDIVLPVGISFYTFQSMSYTFDIYRGKMRPWKFFSDFALFVTFFPQLVAGPIVRAADFLPQLETPRKISGRQMGGGFCLLTIGKFQILRRLVGFPAIDGSSPVPVLENLAENIADVDRILRGRIEREMEFQKKAAPLPLDKLL